MHTLLVFILLLHHHYCYSTKVDWSVSAWRMMQLTSGWMTWWWGHSQAEIGGEDCLRNDSLCADCPVAYCRGQWSVSETAVVCCEQISVGDFVAVKPDDPTVALYIGKVTYLYHGGEKLSSVDQKMAHIMWFKWIDLFLSPIAIYCYLFRCWYGTVHSVTGNNGIVERQSS